MRRRVLVGLFGVLIACSVFVSAQAVPTVSGGGGAWPYYFNPSDQRCLPAINFIGGVPPAGSAWLGVDACPEPTVDPGGSWWGLLKDFLDGKVLYAPAPDVVAKILAVLGSFLLFVQGLKKTLEKASKWTWLLSLVPQVKVILDFLSHGVGPMILNALITGGTMLTAALGDGRLTGGEILGIVSAVVGTDVLYRLIYDKLHLLPRNVGS